MKERSDFLIKLLKTFFSNFWKKFIEVKYKISFELYSAEKERNKKISQRLKNEKNSIDKIKNKLHSAYAQLEIRNNTIKKYEEENKKLHIKNNLLLKSLEEEKNNNLILTQKLKEIEALK